jgi:hypothetical protein
MPSFSLATQISLLQLLFQGAALPPLKQLYIALHNANPGEAGTQSTNETSYSNYARVAVPCSPGSWLVASGDPPQAQNLQSIIFPACGATGDTLSFWSAGVAASGSGQIVTSGPVGATAAYGFSADVMDNFFVPLLPAGYVVGQPVILYQFGPGMLLPGGFVEGQVYYIASISQQDVLLSATPGGHNLGGSTAGTGLFLPVSPLIVVSGMSPTFPPNSLLTFSD